MIYVDGSGKLKITVSLPAQESSTSIFTPEVKHKFMQAIGREDKPQQPTQDSMWRHRVS